MSHLPSRPRRTQGPHTYREPDTESEDSAAEQPIARKARPTRSIRRRQSYRETSSTDSDGSEGSSESLPPAQSSNDTTPGRTNVVRRRSQRHARTKQPKAAQRLLSVSIPLSSFKRRKTSQNTKVVVKAVKNTTSLNEIPVNTAAPPWQTLEYRILLKIVQYASQPLYLGTFKMTDSVNWLLGLSLLCRSFHEAATAALLWEPPLLPANYAHGLINLLSQDQMSLSTTYCTKIKSLNIEARSLLVKKSGIQLDTLLRLTPLLSRLRIFHAHDEMVGKAIWAEPSVAHFKWSYGDLFDCLDRNNIRLRSFEWNGRFRDTVSAMQSAHARPCLERLEEISIVNFNFTDKQELEQVTARDGVISALSQLRSVRHLEFHHVTILDPVSMPQLPLELHVLKLTNCLSLTSELVGTYTSLAGVSLRELDLAGNQVMDLGFMSSLATDCPHLEHLSIDLEYEDCSSYQDRRPLYDDLLPNGSPTWPPELISIVIGPLRSLAVADAENFYDSLVNAAPTLSYLRILKVRTLLKDASWRDRAQLRSKWGFRFRHVFATNKTYRPITVTKSERIAEVKVSKQRKSVRLQEQEDAASEDFDEGDTTQSEVSTFPRQNRCEIVEFELSDQRPAQEQFREADFLDSEASGDEEWNGRDVPPSNSMYTW